MHTALCKLAYSGLAGRRRDTRMMLCVLAAAFALMTAMLCYAASGTRAQDETRKSIYGSWQIARYALDDELAWLRRTKLGFVFQAFNLLPEYTIRDNILLPLMLDKKAVDEAYLKFLTERLGLADLLHRQPGQLSGGQQQRAAIARALIVHPAVVLADEPTGNLDRKNSEEVFSLIRAVAAEQHQTVVYVTHDPDLAQAADRILEMEDGEIRLDSI